MTELLIFLFLALGVSFLCSILEASLMSTPISFITMKEEEGVKSAARLKRYKQDPSRPLAAILSLNTIANTIGAAGVGKTATALFGAEWFGLVSAITTIIILICSEIIPKTIGTTRWRSLTGFTATVISVLIFVLYPIVVSVEYVQKLIRKDNGNDISISRDEISAMAEVAEETGELEKDENEIIQNIINIDELEARDAMTPRVVAAIAPESMSIKRFYKDRRFLHHSRIPVYADNDEYITGYILRMDALQLMAEDKFDCTLSDIRRDISSFQEDTTVDKIWDEMLKSKEQIAIIIDDYGSFQGLLTMEDIIETILGDEIVDERDEVVDMQQLARERWQKLRKKRVVRK